MECELVEAPSTKKKACEVFQEAFPMYLSLGMSYDEFYNKDCTLTLAYLKAHELKQKYNNNNMWLQGMYIYDALTRVSPIFNPYAKSGTTPIPYPEEPYPLNKEEQEAAEEKREKAQSDKIKAYLEQRMDVINQRFGGR